MTRIKRRLLPLFLILLLLTSCGSPDSTEVSADDPSIESSPGNTEAVHTPTAEPISTPAVNPSETIVDTQNTPAQTPVPTTTADTTDHASDIPDEPTNADEPANADASLTEAPTSEPATSSKGTRDNTSVCRTPSAPGTVTYTTDISLLDISNASEGYICASYYGTCPKVKFQITGPDAVTYTYNLHGGYEFFPLSAGSGTYTFGIYENITSSQYSVNMLQTIDITITNTFGPFLYPNQYCMFNSSSTAVKKAAELAYTANNDLDVVTSVYNYVVQNISYDYAKAANITSGYVCDVDATLASRTGICLDYAAVMTCMLRSQNIPTRLEVGYAGSAYHAWISTYITDVGWVNGIIQFDGVSWSLMDPTFAANSSEEELRSFIGDGSNYTLKYRY